MLARLCGLRRQLPDHRRCVARPHRIDRPARAVRSDLPAINLLVLLVAAFLPFPTWLVADALHEVGAERVAVTIYGLTMLAIRLLGSALGGICTARAPLLPAGRRPESRSPQRKLLLVVIGYVIAILIGLVAPVAAVGLYFGITVYLIVPFRQVARLLVRRP